VPESTWDESIGAGGGGASALFTKPAFQSGPVVPADGKRDVPDVAMIASPDKPGVFLGADLGGAASIACCWGGTSVGAPIWAGISKLLADESGRRVGQHRYATLQAGEIGRRFGGPPRRDERHQQLQHRRRISSRKGVRSGERMGHN
jgi:subtilase family serine protease